MHVGGKEKDMSNKEIIKTLVGLLATDSVKDTALKNVVYLLLDQEEPEKKEEPKKETRGRKPGRKPVIDWPKAEACHNAGWDYAKIADELKCTEQTVRNHFKMLEV